MKHSFANGGHAAASQGTVLRCGAAVIHAKHTVEHLCCDMLQDLTRICRVRPLKRLHCAEKTLPFSSCKIITRSGAELSNGTFDLLRRGHLCA